MYLTTKVVAKFGATSGCSGCVGLGSHTEGCRARLEKALADEKTNAGVLGAGVGPIAEPVTAALAAQQEPASSSSGPAVPMPAQSLKKKSLPVTFPRTLCLIFLLVHFCTFLHFFIILVFDFFFCLTSFFEILFSEFFIFFDLYKFGRG